MPASTFKKIPLKDDDANRLQDAIKVPLDRILALPILNSLLLISQVDAQGHTVPLTLSATPKNVPHGLGRTPLGWVLVSPNADVRVYEDSLVDPAHNPDPTKFIRLTATAAVSCRILVF